MKKKMLEIIFKHNAPDELGRVYPLLERAAGTDLSKMANVAFGSSTDRDKQLKQARKDFPLIKY